MLAGVPDGYDCCFAGVQPVTWTFPLPRSPIFQILSCNVSFGCICSIVTFRRPSCSSTRAAKHPSFSFPSLFYSLKNQCGR